MDNERTRLRVRLGSAEIEYEGGIQFLKDEIMPTVSKILEVVESQGVKASASAIPIDQPGQLLASTVDVTHSTNTIATLLIVKSASDLAMAAVAHLTLIQKKDRMSRQEILDEMKTATSFFKASFVNNHSNTLKMLVKSDRLRLIAADTYGLSHKERKELEKVLAQAQ